MGGFSIWHWMLFGAVALLLFGGKGKISDIMGDVAKGIKSFKKGMADGRRRGQAGGVDAPAQPRKSRRRRGRRQRDEQGQLTRLAREPVAGRGARRSASPQGFRVAGPLHVRF